MTHPLLDLVAREHPAFVHVPLGLVVTLPLAMLASYRSKSPRVWMVASFFIAAVAWLGSAFTLYSGLLWGRLIALVPNGSYFPQITSNGQVLQHMLQRHEQLALSGVLLGLVCLILLWRALKRPEANTVGLPTLITGVMWAMVWAGAGKIGGIMVFGNEETNKAAAAADEAKRNDAEADLPIRALDYASLEPAQADVFRSKAHGDRWGRVWVTASGIDAYQAGKPLPSGAYAVMSTIEDAKGKPSQNPGPLYMRETRADGSVAFAFYWPRVPEASRKEMGDDSVYWRSPNPKLSGCANCHNSAGPASKS